MGKRSMLDALEPRRMFSVTAGASLVKGKLEVIGTTSADTISVASNGADKIDVTFNGTKTTYARSQVKSLDIAGDAGNDAVSISLTAALAKKLGVKVQAGAGNDTVTTNVAGTFDGGDGNDALTGTAAGQKLLGGAGDDTISESANGSSISDKAGTNKLTFANGDVQFGDLSLKTDKKGQLTITGGKGNDAFVFAKGAGNLVTVTDGAQSTSFDLTKVKSILVDGGKGANTITKPANIFGSVPVKTKSISTGA